MKKLLLSVLFLSACGQVYAKQVIDTFDSNANPNEWGWLNGQGTFATIPANGGNPGGWLDSGLCFHTDNPTLNSFPSAGTALRQALDSGQLAAAQFDYERLDQGACGPIFAGGSFALVLWDLHSDPGHAAIDAYVVGPASPDGPSAWQTVAFSIPFASSSVPDGWTLEASPDLTYGWQDLMHNIDAISFQAIAPGTISFSGMWRVGADNVVVTYGDEIFTGDFE